MAKFVAFTMRLPAKKAENITFQTLMISIKLRHPIILPKFKYDYVLTDSV